MKVDLSVADDAVEILATVRTTDRTGVEMEALTAVSVAALTVIDMIKAVDKSAVITDVRVEAKSGGKSGDYRRPRRRSGRMTVPEAVPAGGEREGAPSAHEHRAAPPGSALPAPVPHSS